MARGPLTSLLARVADQHEPRGRPRTLAGRVARLAAGGGHAAGSRPLRELDITRPEPSRTCGGGIVHVKAAELLRRSADVSLVAHEATLQLMQVRAWLASTDPRAGVTANQQQAVKDGGRGMNCVSLALVALSGIRRCCGLRIARGAHGGQVRALHVCSDHE